MQYFASVQKFGVAGLLCNFLNCSYKNASKCLPSMGDKIKCTISSVTSYFVNNRIGNAENLKVNGWSYLATPRVGPVMPAL